eukprot:scaffold45292_cov28-Prasinocladus_malaysianus.AAC.3
MSGAVTGKLSAAITGNAQREAPRVGQRPKMVQMLYVANAVPTRCQYGAKYTLPLPCNIFIKTAPRYTVHIKTAPKRCQHGAMAARRHGGNTVARRQHGATVPRRRH